MFSLRGSIIILLILFIPFCLRTFWGIEPYPAVLLPSGAGTIKKTNNHVTLESKQVYGLDSSSNWKKINMSLFISPIPMEYLPVLLSANFGLNIDSSTSRSTGSKILRKLHLASVTGTATNKDKRREIEKWLKEKLDEQHFNPSKIKIPSYVQTISSGTGAILENKIKNERIISLDQ